MEAFGYFTGVVWGLLLIIGAVCWVSDFIRKHWGKKPEKKKPMSITDFERHYLRK